MPETRDPDESGRRRALAAILFLIILVAGAVWLADSLHREAAREDCLAGGRRDCAPLSSSAP